MKLRVEGRFGTEGSLVQIQSPRPLNCEIGQLSFGIAGLSFFWTWVDVGRIRGSWSSMRPF
jgi:hypothetical protein